VNGNGEARVLGGTKVLVYDPRALARYGAEPPFEPDERTRHGYLVVDLERRPGAGGPREARVEAIYLVHCSLASTGASLEPVSGRKALKTLWHFATALLRGDDYYEPAPLNLADPTLDASIAAALRRLAERYRGRFHEAFGSHDKVLNEILRRTFG
jgi:hypothetical protein